jgi:CHRD domain
MTTGTRNSLRTSAVAIGIAVALAGCSMMKDAEHRVSDNVLSLTGAKEVPPVTTSATGSGWVHVHADHTVTAKITVADMTPTASHIHMATSGANGPVIVPFVKEGDYVFVAPPGAKLSDEQYEAFKAGKLYVNVHSAKNPSGEIRAQIQSY